MHWMQASTSEGTRRPLGLGYQARAKHAEANRKGTALGSAKHLNSAMMRLSSDAWRMRPEQTGLCEATPNGQSIAAKQRCVWSCVLSKYLDL